jgi:hypothetical protein
MYELREDKLISNDDVKEEYIKCHYKGTKKCTKN